jgi:hypothetical protein
MLNQGGFKMKKNFLAGFLTLLFMVFLSSFVSATTLTFEDAAFQYQNAKFGDPGTNYGGFEWSSNFDVYYGPAVSLKYDAGTVSGNYAMFNAYGVDVSLSGKKFNWTGAWFTDPSNNTLLNITGYLNGALVYNTNVQLAITKPVWFEANWTGIDTLYFDVKERDWFTMDDFTFTDFIEPDQFIAERDAEPVPEPATLFLFGTGLVGLAGSIKKRRK